MSGLKNGCPYPLGATVHPGGTNFSIFSASATGMELVLFGYPDDGAAARFVTLDPVQNRTSHYWHIFLPGIKPGQLYGYRVDGPSDPAAGQRFDRQKILLDPYGVGVSVGKNYSRAAACVPGDNAGTSMKSVVADLSLFDWEGDRKINRLFRETVIYEMHVAGFTRHPSSGVPEAHRGTYLGVIEKIPYLVSLGITAVELMPVFQFDSADAPSGLANYWGYDPVSFFAPHLGYSTAKDDAVACLDEFRTMV
jgi:isoamylase